MRKTAFPAAAMLAAVLVAAPVAAQEVRVLNWQGYGTDEVWAVDLFQDETGIEVVHDYFNSEQEMLTKLRTSPGAYDVVLINSAYTRQAAEEGLIAAIDPAAISNFDDLSPGLRNAAEFAWQGALYGVAWTWGVTSIAYDTDEVTPGDSIDILWDPAYADNVAVRDDSVENVYLAALATGQNMNAPADLDAIREKLRALKPQLRTFWSSEDEWNKGVRRRQLRRGGLLVRFGLAQRQGFRPAGGLSDPAGGRHRLARRPVAGGRCAQSGRRAGVHRFHGQPRTLCGVG